MNPTNFRFNAPSNGVKHELSLGEFYSLVVGGKIAILVFLLAGLAAATAYTLIVKPTYESTSQVLIDTKTPRGNLPHPQGAVDDPANKLANELEALRSVSLAGMVSDVLISRRYLDSAASVVIPIVAAAEAEAGAGPPARQLLVEELHRSLEFAPVKEADILNITARSSNPREAALLANTYTSCFVDRSLTLGRSRTKAAREFLQAQLAEKHSSLDSSENKLQKYMQASGIVALDEDTKKLVEQLAQLEANRDAVDIEIGSRTRTLQSSKEELTKLAPTVAKSLGESGDAYIRLLQEQLARLELQRDFALTQYPNQGSGAGGAPQQLKEVESQIDQLNKKLRERTASFVETVYPSNRRTGNQEGFTGFLGELKQKVIEQQVEIDGLNARRQALNRVMKDYERQFNATPQKSIDYARLQRTRLSSEKLYLMVEEKFNELAISESSEMSKVVVIDEAVVPRKPIRPIWLLNLALGALTGLAGGMLLVILRAVLEVRIIAAEDLRKRGFNVLSTVGKMQRNTLSKVAARRNGNSGMDPHLVVATAPLHPAAESFRHLYTSVKHSCKQASCCSLVITSPNPSEGKSTTAGNLALAAAESGKTILLIDADLRRPALHLLFNVKNEEGLSECLRRGASYEAVMHPGVVEHVDLLTCGSLLDNPGAALAGDSLDTLLRDVQDKYDLVIFDAPPLHAASDASVLASKTTGAVVVVSAGQTSVSSLEGGVETLQHVGGTVLGIVLNNYDVRRSMRYGYGEATYGYYGYGYSRYSSKVTHKVGTHHG